jgi:disulfide bond formation protein DsbB
MQPHKVLSNQAVLRYVILIVSLLAVLGSLYYQFFGDPVSNIQLGNLLPSYNGYNPCLMCWWQRIFMYPIALVALIATLTKDSGFARYTLGLSVVGIPFSVYHYFIQKVKVVGSTSCSLDNPCSASEVNYLGFITIPLLALIAFCIIMIASYLHIRRQESK